MARFIAWLWSALAAPWASCEALAGEDAETFALICALLARESGGELL